MPTATFSEARRNLTEIADRVASEGVEYTVFKRSKPLFKIVPVSDDKMPARRWTRREVALRAEGRSGDASRTARSAIDGPVGPREASDPHGGLGPIPDGGTELFEYAMRLRERMPKGTPLSTMTCEDIKRELADRDV